MIGERIKELRKVLGISQEKFGEKLCLSRSGISNIEKGIREVNNRHIRDICREFNVNEEWLRAGKGEMFNTPDDLVELLSYTVDTLNQDEQKFLINFLSMNENDRHETLKYLRKLIGK